MGEKKAYELALLDQAGQALAEAESLGQIKEIRDKAEAVRKYAQSASLGLGVQNRAAEVKLRAERQAGKLLSQMMLRGGDRRSKTHNERLKLDDLGISRNQSTRWQIQAKVPENVFREHIKQTCDAGRELTSASLVRLAKRWDNAAERSAVGQKNGKGVHRNQTLRPRVHRTPADTFAEILEELANHHQLMDNVLRPLYSGEGKGLEPAERRVLRYLLLEVQQLISRLDKMRQAGSLCSCHDNGIH